MATPRPGAGDAPLAIVMPLAIVLNELADKGDRFTPFLLAHEAWRRGRDVWVVRLDDVSILPDGTVVAAAATVPRRTPEGPDLDRGAWVAALKDPANRLPEVDLAAAALVLLRNTPASQERHGFRGDNPGAALGRLLESHGVRVVNRPAALALAGSKAYLTALPAGATPATLVTRDVQRVRDFVEALPGPAIVKPAVGFGGEEVFLVRPGGRDTLPTMVEVIRRHGYVCVQAFVPEAEQGDVRVLLVRGDVPLVEGRPAAYRRVHAPGDFRNNVHAGAQAAPPDWGPREAALCRTVGARLRRDGLDLVGLDIAGGKVLDVNVYNPGGLRLMGEVHGVDFAGAVLDALEAELAPGERLNLPGHES